MIPPLLITFFRQIIQYLDKNNDYMQTLQSGVISEAEMSSGIPRTSKLTAHDCAVNVHQLFFLSQLYIYHSIKENTPSFKVLCIRTYKMIHTM